MLEGLSRASRLRVIAMSAPSTETPSTPATPVPPAKFLSPRSVSLYGVLIALTAAVTMLVAIPFPPTRGFFNLGDSVVFFTAFTFGVRAGGICGGIGSAAADVLLGYGYFAPITLVTKGAEGLVAGLVGGRQTKKTWALGLGVAAGGVCMVTGYFLGEWVYYGLGPAIAEIPVNITQVAVGGTVGIAISYLVMRFLQRSGR